MICYISSKHWTWIIISYYASLCNILKIYFDLCLLFKNLYPFNFWSFKSIFCKFCTPNKISFVILLIIWKWPYCNNSLSSFVMIAGPIYIDFHSQPNTTTFRKLWKYLDLKPFFAFTFMHYISEFMEVFLPWSLIKNTYRNCSSTTS